MTKPMIIIGLAGPAGCGKDTVADLLRTHADFYKLAFADALRDEVCAAYLMEPLYLTRRETKEHPMSALALRKCGADGFVARLIMLHEGRGQPLDLDAPRSPRQIMQWWGTEYRRHMDDDYWLRQVQRRVERLIISGGHSRFVLTDVRFANEVALLRDLGGLLWQVDRPGCGVAAGAHVSEVTGEDFAPDAVLDNSGDMRHLQGQVLSHYAAHEWSLPGLRVEVAA